MIICSFSSLFLLLRLRASKAAETVSKLKAQNLYPSLKLSKTYSFLISINDCVNEINSKNVVVFLSSNFQCCMKTRIEVKSSIILFYI